MLKGINLQLFAEGDGVQSGVNNTAAAGQETTAGDTTEATTKNAANTDAGPTETGNETGNETGVKDQKPAAEVDKVEKAFAARLKEALVKEREKAEQEFNERISQLYGNYGIKTYSELEQAIRRQREQEQLQELLERNIPEEYAKEMLESRKFREMYEAERKAREAEERQRAEFKDFVEAYPDVKAEDIPIEVWEANAKGIPLRFAYAEHALKQLKASETKAKANEINARSSMGSVATNGVTSDEYITYESFEKNRHNQEWVNKNFKKIMESRAKLGW